MLLDKHYLRQLFVLFWCFCSLNTYAQVARFVEGVHYTALPETTYAKTLPRTDAKVAVMEIFWYGCPGCYAFDPVLEAWTEAQHARIDFQRSPVIWSAGHKHHARLFFVMQQLGKDAELHSSIFDEVQRHGNPLLDETAAAALFADHGVTAADFTGAYNSFAVDSLLRKTEAMQKELRIPAVPVMIVAGKYMVQGNAALASHDAMLAVVEFLVDKETAAQ